MGTAILAFHDRESRQFEKIVTPLQIQNLLLQLRREFTKGRHFLIQGSSFFPTLRLLWRRLQGPLDTMCSQLHPHQEHKAGGILPPAS